MVRRGKKEEIRLYIGETRSKKATNTFVPQKTSHRVPQILGQGLRFHSSDANFYDYTVYPQYHTLRTLFWVKRASNIFSSVATRCAGQRVGIKGAARMVGSAFLRLCDV